MICLWCGFALTAGVKAVANTPTTDDGNGESGSAGDNPYTAIVERNVFDLKPPVKPGKTDEKTNTPPLNIRLTGITSILGNKRALFMVQEGSAPGKGGQQNKEESYIMTEGQRQGALEVLEIDEKAETVKVKNDGVVSTIPIEVPKVASAPGGPGGNLPGSKGQHAGQAGGFGRPGINPDTGNGAIRLPTRALRTAPGPSQTGFSPASAYQGGLLQGGISPQVALSTGGATPVTLTPGAASATPTLATPGQPGLSAEEQVIIAEAQQQMHQAEIQAGRFPTLPPIPGVPGLQLPTPEVPQINSPTSPTTPPLGQRTTGSLQGGH